jgi:hypothetical protein
MVERIDALTLEEVRAAGLAALRTTPTVAVVGDVKKAPRSQDVAQRLSGV